MSGSDFVLVGAGITTGWFAGLLYSFSVAVVPGLRASSAKAHIEVMQKINIKIENPLFFLSFIGPIVFIGTSMYMHRGQVGYGWLSTALSLHLLACLITGAWNIKLNNELALQKVSGLSEKEAESIRQKFQGSGRPWMVFHTLRTLAATGSLACVLFAALAH